MGAERPVQLYIMTAELPGITGVALIETLGARGSAAKIVALTYERATPLALTELDVNAAFLKQILLSDLVPILALLADTRSSGTQE